MARFARKDATGSTMSLPAKSINLSATVGEIATLGPISKGISAYRPHPETALVWARLAREAAFRLPLSATPLTTGRMEAWLRKAGVKAAGFCAWGGYKKLNDFRRLNPGWSMRSFAGLVLEHRDQMQEAR